MKPVLLALIFIVFTVNIYSSYAHALKPKSYSSFSQPIKTKSLYIGMSVLSHDLFNVSQNGNTGFLGPFYYPISIQSHFELWDNWYIGPRFNYTLLLNRASPDGGSKTSYMLITLPLENTFAKFDDSGFSWEVGPSLLVYSLQGSGGTTQLPNGTGTTTYALPGSTVNSTTWALDLGVGYNLSNFQIELDTLTEAIFSSARRTFSLMLTLSYNVIN